MTNLTTYKKVELNGEERLLKFDYNSTCDLEDIYGKGIAAILTEEQIGFKLVRAFYWAGLKWKMHGLTVEKVGQMLGKEIQENGKNVMELMEPVMDALKKSKLLSNGNEKAIDAEYEELPEGDEPKN
jgi:hypothetical protein